MSVAFDPEIVKDFLTESGELLEQFEGDLVSLEADPRDADLLNRVFRALHTIKGSASFLALTNLVEVAHAAESALNAARGGQVVIDRPAMDLLLAVVDVLKTQLAEVSQGKDLTRARRELVAGLDALASSTQPAPPVARETDRSLDLPPEKASILEFFVADLADTLEKFDTHMASLSSAGADHASALAHALELAEAAHRSASFFDLEPLSGATRLLARLADEAARLDLACVEALAGRARDLTNHLREQGSRLARGLSPTGVGDALARSLDSILAGDAPPGPAPDAPTPEGPNAPARPSEPPAGAASPTPASPGANAPPGTPAHADQTIRVDVSRLEALMNLVGELVLQKNRILSLSRQVASGRNGAEAREALTLSAGALDRVTSDIQISVMRTRMQPLDKIFGKYPRLIRDLCGKTGKKIRLVVEGGETEVDKSVIEELGDPMVHLLRNAADHGIEPPDQRAGSGKPEEGVIRLAASHEGNHVLVRIEDDGRGLSRERLGRKAIERGLLTEERLGAMTDREVHRLIFAAGFSTAERVTDLSGRGVGMDVVRTNIERLKGSVDLESVEGRGTSVLIRIPLTVAIMQAMLVGVAREIYAIPLTNILEIVRPEEGQVSTIRERPCLRLRESVIPLLDACEVLGVPQAEREPCPFAVVLADHDRRVALGVSRLIGQQEIVIKRLDESLDHAGERTPVSGATVRDDGGVSLIIDVGAMLTGAGA